MAAPTRYAIKRGAGVSSIDLVGNGEKAGCWWLRSPGFISSIAAYVDYDGDVYDKSYILNRSSVSVRPALWLNLES
jgi:hypothetical protein